MSESERRYRNQLPMDESAQGNGGSIQPFCRLSDVITEELWLLVLGRFAHTVNHKHLDGTLGTFESEAELFL
jgi:hypothetical protein